MTNLRRASPTLAALAFCLGLSAPSPARAQSDDPQRALAAQALYDQAIAEMDAKKLESACRKLSEVVRLLPEAIGAKLTLAECYEAQGKLASAWSQYALAEALAAKAGDVERSKAAGASAAALKPRLATLTIEVPEPVRMIPGLAIARDGAPVGEGQWWTALPVDAGRHEVVATAPGRKPWKGWVDVAADGVTASISVRAPEAERRANAGPVTTGDKQAARPWQRPAAFALMGLGGVGVAVGSVLGGLALAKNGESNEGDHCDAEDRCDPTGLKLRSAALGLATGSTAAVVAGAVVLSGGVVLFVTAPRGEPTRAPASARGARLRAGVELVPLGVRVRGEW